jgi:hypothetical protein
VVESPLPGRRVAVARRRGVYVVWIVCLAAFTALTGACVSPTAPSEAGPARVDAHVRAITRVASFAEAPDIDPR